MHNSCCRLRLHLRAPLSLLNSTLSPFLHSVCSTEMAALETRDHEFSHSAHTLGVAHQGNRIAFRLRSRILFYFPAVAHVGQHYDCHSVGGLCHWTGGVCVLISSVVIVVVLQPFVTFINNISPTSHSLIPFPSFSTLPRNTMKRIHANACPNRNTKWLVIFLRSGNSRAT